MGLYLGLFIGNIHTHNVTDCDHSKLRLIINENFIFWKKTRTKFKYFLTPINF